MALPIAQAVDLLRAARHVVLTTHIDPDGDGVGSQVALAGALKAIGLSVTVLNAEPIPPRYAFLDPDGAIRVHQVGSPLPPADLIVVLDTGAWAQLGALEAVVRAHPSRRLIIDHHVTGDLTGEMVLADPSAPCTGWLVLRVIDALATEVTPAAAEALFTALVFDTGWLRFSNADQRAYDMAARLVRAGADPHRVYLLVDERQPAPALRLLGMALAGLELAASGTLGILTITGEMFRATDTTPADVSKMVNACYQVEGVHSALLLVELPPDEVRLSFRSRGVVDVSELAARYGGGGHARAAGARLTGPLHEVRRRVIADFERAILDAS